MSWGGRGVDGEAVRRAGGLVGGERAWEAEGGGAPLRLRGPQPMLQGREINEREACRVLLAAWERERA